HPHTHTHTHKKEPAVTVGTSLPVYARETGRRVPTDTAGSFLCVCVCVCVRACAGECSLLQHTDSRCLCVGVCACVCVGGRVGGGGARGHPAGSACARG